ncbi:hypothetical protein FRB91_004513, partial [Serendipita sp. 411]
MISNDNLQVTLCLQQSQSLLRMKLSALTFLLLIAGGVAAIPVEDSVEAVETESSLDEVTTFDADAGDVLVTSADDIYTADATDGT